MLVEVSLETISGSRTCSAVQRVFKREVTTQLEAHNAIKGGLPGGALHHLVTHLRVLKPASIERAVGMSVRTYQRRKGAPDRPLSPEQGGRTWKLAEVLAQGDPGVRLAGGGRAVAGASGRGAGQQPPAGPPGHPQPGSQMVEDFLGRLAYGVYT